MIRATVLTSIMDDYDTLKPVLPQDGAEVNWLCLTDSIEIINGSRWDERGLMHPTGWEIIAYERPADEHPNRAAKRPKMHPGMYSDAPASVWIDASFRVVSPRFVADVTTIAAESAYGIAQFRHPWRSCAPGDQLVRTVRHGDVRIDELQEGVHRLAAYDPLRRRVVIGHNGHGYGFTRAVRPFTGSLIKMTTNATQVRVTPDHWVAARWTPEASSPDTHCTYLMRRGDWWRIGKSRMHHGEGRHFGPGVRGRNEGADEMWVLGVYSSNAEALQAEQYLCAQYGITGAVFQNRSSQWACHVTDEMLKDLHSTLAREGSGERARKLLADLGLSLEIPFWNKGGTTWGDGRGLGASFPLKIRAGNLISGWIEVPLADGSAIRWERATVTRDPVVNMPVYSLDVERHHSYIGDGQAVYNCLFEEAAASLALPKYHEEDARIKAQSQAYRDAGMPSYFGLWATGVIARVHSRPVLDWGMAWSRQIDAYSYQDQISHPFTLWRQGLRPVDLPGDHFHNSWLAYEGSARHG